MNKPITNLTQGDFIVMPIPTSMFTAVCALMGALGGAAPADIATATANASRGLTAADMGQPGNAKATGGASRDTDKFSATDETLAQESQGSAGTGETATTDASPSDGEVDAGGHPWSADLHASTKGKTKDGLWRMKVGVSRPDPLPGSPAATGADTGTSSATDTVSATSQTATASESAPTTTSTEEDDEFAAFRNAAAASDTADQAAAASVPARKFSDADLGALCNQAAVKLGDPNPIKEIIARFVPAGEVAHSRNIPEASREEFAQAVEAKAGITFAAA